MVTILKQAILFEYTKNRWIQCSLMFNEDGHKNDSTSFLIFKFIDKITQMVEPLS